MAKVEKVDMSPEQLSKLLFDQRCLLSRDLFIERSKGGSAKEQTKLAEECWRDAGLYVDMFEGKLEAAASGWKGTALARVVNELEGATGFDLNVRYDVPASKVWDEVIASFRELGQTYETARIHDLLDVDPQAISGLASLRNHPEARKGEADRIAHLDQIGELSKLIGEKRRSAVLAYLYSRDLLTPPKDETPAEAPIEVTAPMSEAIAQPEIEREE